MQYNRTVFLKNSQEKPLKIYLEPWGIELDCSVGQTFEIFATGSMDGELEVERQRDNITVWGWPTSRLVVKCDENIICDANVPVPNVPNHLRVSTFLKMMLGANDKNWRLSE